MRRTPSKEHLQRLRDLFNQPLEGLLRQLQKEIGSPFLNAAFKYSTAKKQPLLVTLSNYAEFGSWKHYESPWAVNKHNSKT